MGLPFIYDGEWLVYANSFNILGRQTMVCRPIFERPIASVVSADYCCASGSLPQTEWEYWEQIG